MRKKKKNVSILWRITSNDSNIGKKPEKQIIKNQSGDLLKNWIPPSRKHTPKSKLSIPHQHAGGTCADSCNGNKKKKSSRLHKSTERFSVLIIVKRYGLMRKQTRVSNDFALLIWKWYLPKDYCLFLLPFQNTSILFWTWGTQNYFLVAFSWKDVLVSNVNLWWKSRKREGAGGVTL